VSVTIKPFNVCGIPRIVFGEGRFRELPQIITSFGLRALIVTGSRSFVGSACCQSLTDSLGEAGVSWDVVKVNGEPSPDVVDQTAADYHKEGIAVVVGIGGGSAIDAAKAIAGLLPRGNSVMDHLEVVGRGIPYHGHSVPLIAVPTTSGTGAEATKNAVLSATGPDGFKRSFRHDSLAPKVALVDPELTYGCPPDLTAAAGMDAVTQLLESYVSINASLFTDALALSGLTVAKDGLLRAYEGDPEGRSAMSYAALLSGITLAHAGLGVVHGLASPLGGYFPIPHGVACAGLLGTATKMNIAILREREPDSPALHKYAEVGRLFSGKASMSQADATDSLVDSLSVWTERLQAPKLGAFGIAEADLAKIAAGCSAKTNPAALTSSEVISVLRESL
jgi:alcohol dehydrogenase class IV